MNSAQFRLIDTRRATDEKMVGNRKLSVALTAGAVVVVFGRPLRPGDASVYRNRIIVYYCVQ